MLEDYFYSSKKQASGLWSVLEGGDLVDKMTVICKFARHVRVQNTRMAGSGTVKLWTRWALGRMVRVRVDC